MPGFGFLLATIRLACKTGPAAIERGERPKLQGETYVAEQATVERGELLALVGEIVAAHVGNNATTVEELPT